MVYSNTNSGQGVPSEWWLSRALGKHYFYSATHIVAGFRGFDKAPITDDVVAAIVSLPHLEFVELDSPQISNREFEILSSCTELRALHVSCLSSKPSQLSEPDISCLGRLTSLHELLIADIPNVGGRLDFLRRLRKLQSLTVSGANLSSSDIQAIGDLAQLRLLDLSRCQTPTDGLGELRNLVRLEVLELSSITIDSELINTLAPIRGLKELSVYNANYGNDQYDDLQAVLPGCQLLLKH
jgi:Leucine-rich repeat (LRR) protein